jgi:hypothetical protein
LISLLSFLESRLIKMYIKEIGLEDADWIHVAQVGTGGDFYENNNEPLGSIKGMEFVD